MNFASSQSLLVKLNILVSLGSFSTMLWGEKKKKGVFNLTTHEKV